MPFFGQDWRSPGDQWVRTTEGWERTKLWRVKIFDNLNHNVVARHFRLAVEDKDWSQHETLRRQPYIFFYGGATKERLELTSLSEAMVRLDITGAACDLRRASYVIRLVKLILEEKLAALSGTSQRLVFNIVEAIVNEALKSELNFGIVKDVLATARDALYEGRHHHIGSPALWDSHAQTINKLESKVAHYQMKERNRDGRITLPDLPPECLRIIFAQIADHRDVMRAGQTNTTLNQVTEEGLLWRDLCFFHFNWKQINTFLSDNEPTDWKYIYKRCYKRFGRREVYADMLSICSHCCSIHWKSLGHPCISDQGFEAKDLQPRDFLFLFKL